ncbi:MAG: 50S ribosomal protein L25 [Candidatus Pacebacteria bacterium]|nr:50S ribosomal protein L25 [Candidatus Paceibacterota bacterium]MCF7863133.1 50S ribosomal protein L25 [Candidatus Paceibacterota bacterium]
MFSIKAKKRESGVNPEVLRKSGEVPAVFYGAKKESTNVSVSLVEFNKVFSKAGESSAIKMTTENGDVDVLVQDVQRDPVTNTAIHIDFLVIDMNKKIEVSVPLEFVGVSPIVKSGLGTLVKVMHDIEIEALPKDLPQKIEIDISVLEGLDSVILASNVSLPSGVSLITKDTEVVASIAEQKEEVEEVAPVDLSAIEVEKKGKKEEETETPESGENN